MSLFYSPPHMSPDEKKKDSPMPKDSFMDDLLWVAKETVSPTADPKNDPMPHEEAENRAEQEQKK